ncbi:hypothetical protein BOX15_Mlig011678g1 [Macrostomum lignano]|uniref:Uncharacterized protein n=2 Tax=Macrostomum lignano TaxID=282301 RepID=A0A267FFY1_9PLAT|nr:hypothetical protein BOX15_Mlig011678g1 [Macrostomum lignano]
MESTTDSSSTETISKQAEPFNEPVPIEKKVTTTSKQSDESTDESTTQSKRPLALRVALLVLRLLALLLCLYFFVCSLDLMSSAFRLLGGRQVGELLSNNVVFANPVACLMMGVLLTVLVQSSSTSTSLIITMVGAQILELRSSVYMIMGANIGTTVTNTIVSLGQIGDREELERAFAGATVHDMFNWLTVLVLLPLEMASGALTSLTGLIVNSNANSTINVDKPPDFLKAITSPFTGLVIRLDSKLLKDPELLRNSSTLIKVCCKTSNSTCLEKCQFMFMEVAGHWADAIIGGILLALSLAALIGCLVGLVRILRSLLESKVKTTIERVTRTENRCLLFAMDYISLVVGAGLTILVQSSSVLTSALTPLVGTGVITVEIMYPITLGSNIGTTTTGLLAALASGSDSSLQTALVHLFFNVFGVLIWLPVPLLKRVPIALAKKLGAATAAYRWFAIAYILLAFLLLPLMFFALSLLHTAAVYVAFGLLVAPMLVAGVVGLLQTHRPDWLPEFLRNWDFLPEPLRSLAPYDRLLSRIFGCCRRKRNKVDAMVEIEFGKNEEGTFRQS